MNAVKTGRLNVTRWLAILALLWPMIASAHLGTPAPGTPGEMAVVHGGTGSMPSAACGLSGHAVHAHCCHTSQGELAANTVPPEDRDDPGYAPLPVFTPAPAAGASFAILPAPPRPHDRPRFILFGNFRS